MLRNPLLLIKQVRQRLVIRLDPEMPAVDEIVEFLHTYYDSKCFLV